MSEHDLLRNSETSREHIGQAVGHFVEAKSLINFKDNKP